MKLMPSNFLSILVALCLLTSSTLFAQRAYHSIDQTNCFLKKANLSADLQILTDEDGGAYAIKISLHNLSETTDLILEFSDDPEQLIAIQAMPYGTNTLSITRTDVRLKDFEVHNVEMPLKRSTTIEWFVRLSDRIPDIKKLPDKFNAFFGVSMFLQYQVKEEVGRASGIEIATLTFLKQLVLITTKALEGDAAEKYERRQAAALLKSKAEPISVKSETNTTVSPMNVVAHNPPIKTREEVMNDLKYIESAKFQWALEHNKKNGDIPSGDDLLPYFKEGYMPEHPANGRYIVNAIGVAPESSIYGKRQP